MTACSVLTPGPDWLSAINGAEQANRVSEAEGGRTNLHADRDIYTLGWCLSGATDPPSERAILPQRLQRNHGPVMVSWRTSSVFTEGLIRNSHFSVVLKTSRACQQLIGLYSVKIKNEERWSGPRRSITLERRFIFFLFVPFR